MRAAPATVAVVLRSVPYGEADRVVTLLTEAHGKVSVLAPSARKSRRRMPPGALEPFGICEAEIALGSGELGRLAGARLVRGFPRLLGLLERMEIAGAALERVREIVPAREPEPRLVRAVEELFERLDGERAGSELGVAFELRLLALCGLTPRLGTCGACGKAAGDRAALFEPGRGSIVCRACGGGPFVLSAPARLSMLACLGERWASAAEGWSAAQLEEVRAAVEAFRARHVGLRREPGGAKALGARWR